MFGYLFDLLDRIAGESHSELLEDLPVNLTQHHCRMDLTSVKFRKLVESFAAVLIFDAEHRESDKHFVCMQTRIMSVKV